jgi:hypothetical protein
MLTPTATSNSNFSLKSTLVPKGAERPPTAARKPAGAQKPQKEARKCEK